jgi:pimeloyl-ACP methyl ester carboxylesterase
MATATNKGNYAPVNGLNLYYEIYGTGRPMIMLHGGLGSIGMFNELLPALAKSRQVIGVELQAHGHTADIDRPFSFEQLGDDVAALIMHLGLANADVLGYSLGGGASLQVAIRHPDVVRKLVLLATPCKRDGWYPEVLQGMSFMNAEAAKAMVGSPPHAAYVSAAPRPDDWTALVSKTGDLLKKDYDWSDGVRAMKVPTLVAIGDADSVRPSHAVEMYELLGGGPVILTPDGRMGTFPNSQLAILPGTSHFTILDRTDLLVPIVTQFLDAPTLQNR